jgi:zinc protease
MSMTGTHRAATPALAVASLLLMLLATSARADGLQATRTTLANGLRVVLAPDANATAVDVALWFPSGTRHERPAQAGLALITARLGFRAGAEDPLAPMTATGGTGSVVVTPDYTSWWTTVPPAGLPDAIAFLAARMKPVPVTPAALAAERAAIQAERTRGERTPAARGIAKLWSASWPAHPYASTGAPPSYGADALKAADVDAWRRARYACAGAVITVTGAFDPDSALAGIRTAFEKLPKGNAPSAAAAPAPRAAQRANDAVDLPARLCFVGWRGPGLGDADVPALELLATWLGGGPSSRLSSSLVRDWNLALTVQAGFTAQKDGSLLWALAVVPQGVDSVAVERTLLEAAGTAVQRELEAFELERARRQTGATIGFALQTARQRAQVLGEAELLAGDAAVALRRYDAIGKLKPADVRRAAQRVMTDAGRATVWLVPSAKGGAR